MYLYKTITLVSEVFGWSFQIMQNSKEQGEPLVNNF